MATAVRPPIRTALDFREARQKLCEMPDNELPAEYLRGNEFAFNELVARYKRPLTGLCLRYTSNLDDAEDVIQKTFLKVHRKIHRYDPSKKFRTWIFTICHRFCLNFIRDRTRYRQIVIEPEKLESESGWLLQFPDTRLAPDRLFEGRRNASLINMGISRLTKEHRQILLLRECEGMTYQAIADIVHVNLGTVKSRLHRAREAFTITVKPLFD